MKTKEIFACMAALFLPLLTSCSHLKHDVVTTTKPGESISRISPSDILAINKVSLEVSSLVEGTEKEVAYLKGKILESLAAMEFTPPTANDNSVPILRLHVVIKKIKKVSFFSRATMGYLAGRANVTVDVTVSLKINEYEQKITITTAEISAKAPEATFGFWNNIVGVNAGYTEAALDEAVNGVVQILRGIRSEHGPAGKPAGVFLAIKYCLLLRGYFSSLAWSGGSLRLWNLLGLNNLYSF